MVDISTFLSYNISEGDDNMKIDIRYTTKPMKMTQRVAEVAECFG